MTKIDVDESLRLLERGDVPEWIADHLRVYLESEGREGHMWDSSAVGGPGLLPCLVLGTKGRRTGTTRRLPLIYGTTGSSYVVVASKGGAPTHPGWYLNLVADPSVEVQVGSERFAARARSAHGDERDTLWNEMVALYPPYRDYQRKTAREIPVVVLERVDR
jgi:deazaflavin-dependent oxidoreductase (nitroreductase family)